MTVSFDDDLLRSLFKDGNWNGLIQLLKSRSLLIMSENDQEFIPCNRGVKVVQQTPSVSLSKSLFGVRYHRSRQLISTENHFTGALILSEPVLMSTDTRPESRSLCHSDYATKWFTPKFIGHALAPWQELSNATVPLPNDLEVDTAAVLLSMQMSKLMDEEALMEMGHRTAALIELCQQLLKMTKEKRQLVFEIMADAIPPVEHEYWQCVKSSLQVKLVRATYHTLVVLMQDTKWPFSLLLKQFQLKELWLLLNKGFLHAPGHGQGESGASTGLEDWRETEQHIRSRNVYLMQMWLCEMISAADRDCRRPNAVFVPRICPKTKKQYGELYALRNIAPNDVITLAHSAGRRCSIQPECRMMRRLLLYHSLGYWCHCRHCATRAGDPFRAVICPQCTPLEWRGTVKEAKEHYIAYLLPSTWRPLSMQHTAAAPLICQGNDSDLSFWSPSLRHPVETPSAKTMSPFHYVLPHIAMNNKKKPQSAALEWRCDQCQLQTRDPWSKQANANEVAKCVLEAAMTQVFFTGKDVSQMMQCPDRLAPLYTQLYCCLGERHYLVWTAMALHGMAVTQRLELVESVLTNHEDGDDDEESVEEDYDGNGNELDAFAKRRLELMDRVQVLMTIAMTLTYRLFAMQPSSLQQGLDDAHFQMPLTLVMRMLMTMLHLCDYRGPFMRVLRRTLLHSLDRLKSVYDPLIESFHTFMLSALKESSSEASFPCKTASLVFVCERTWNECDKALERMFYD